jgi:hypothetical protein
MNNKKPVSAKGKEKVAADDAPDEDAATLPGRTCRRDCGHPGRRHEAKML